MSKVLVIGSNGLIGQKIISEFMGDGSFEIIAASKNLNKLDLDSFPFELLDITNAGEIEYIINNYKPSLIINTAAITQVDKCEEEKEVCWKVNVEGLQNLVNSANKINAHLVHFSSDFIFDGINGPYREDDNANPLSYYGLSKLEGERIIKEHGKTWTIFRVILVYGIVKYMPRSNIVLWVKNNLEKGNPIKVINDQYRMPTLAEDVAKTCLTICKKNKQGVYHISGSKLMSILEIAYEVADFFKLDKLLISPISSMELNEKARRPKSTGFYLDKAYNDLNYNPTSFTKGLEILKSQLESI